MQQDKNSNKVNQKATKKLFFIIASGCLSLLGIIMFIIYMMNPGNMIVGGVGVFALGFGGVGIWYFWKGSGDFVSTSITSKKPRIEEANVLILHNGIASFEYIYTKENEELPGMERRCRNDNHFYHVLLNDSDIEKPNFIAFTLPDQQYNNPQVFAEKVIGLPAHVKLFTRREGMGQYIKTGILLIAMAIIGVVMIASSGG